MKFYSIRYIESKGIEEFNGKLTSDGTYAKEEPYQYCGRFEKIGKDAFTSRSEAVKAGADRLQRALKAAQGKVERVKAQIKDLT